MIPYLFALFGALHLVFDVAVVGFILWFQWEAKRDAKRAAEMRFGDE